MLEKVTEAAPFGRRFMELGEMFERTGYDSRMTEHERAQEMTRLMHLMRRRMDEAAAILEQTPAEARQLVAA